MQKVLIADGSPTFPLVLTNLLREEFDVKVCQNSVNLLNVICSFKPDVLLLDLRFPAMDGISLLRCMQAKGVYPKVIIVSGTVGYYIQSTLEQLGVAYCMKHPYDPVAAASRIMEISGCPKELIIPMPDERQVLSNMLLVLGLQQKHAGFGFILDIVPRVAVEPGISYTKILYPEAGKRTGKSGNQVERSIRSAVEYAWANRNPAVWELFFPPQITLADQAPANSAFIDSMAIVLSQKKEERYGYTY